MLSYTRTKASIFVLAIVLQVLIVQFSFPEFAFQTYKQYLAPIKPGYIFLYIPFIINHFRYPAPLPNRKVEWKIPEPASAEDKKRPNIILLLADDLGFNDISFFGGGFDKGRISTPNIDSIGLNGVSFKNAYSGKILDDNRSIMLILLAVRHNMDTYTQYTTH
jgi:hypothetical protein